MNLVLRYKDFGWEHGLEFWGLSPQTIVTQATEQAMVNLCISYSKNTIPFVYGYNEAGKTNLIHRFAAIFGQFIYHTPAFADFNPHFLEKIILGSIITGSWVHFSHFNELGNRAKAFVTDKITQIIKSRTSGSNKYFIDENSFDISSNACFFFSCGVKQMKNTEIPSQIRSMCRPVALPLPVTRKIIESKLIAFGFKSAQRASIILENFLVAATDLMRLPQSKNYHAIKIVNESQDILRQLMHSCKVDFVNYYEDPTAAETFSIAKAAYSYFSNFIRTPDLPVLIKLLYKYFPLFGDFEVYEQNLKSHSQFKYDKLWYSIESSLKEYIPSLGLDLPTEYLIQKTYALCCLLMTFGCVVICGPPNSGKSIIIQLLEYAYSKFSQNPSLVNTFKGVMPLKIEEIFHNRLLEAYNNYLIIGGMPECVVSWVNHKDPAAVSQIQRELVEIYENDFSKHNGKVNSGRILMVFRSIVSQLAKSNEKFVYGAVRQGGRARDFEEAIEWLVSAGMLNRIYNVSKMEHPLSAFDKLDQFVTYFSYHLDVAFKIFLMHCAYKISQ